MNISEMREISFNKMPPGDFPGGPGAKTLPSNTEGVGSVPGQGTKIPHATEQLSQKVPSHPKLNK